MPKGPLIPFCRETQSRHIWLRISLLGTSLVLAPILLYHAIEKPMILLRIRLVTRLRDKEPEPMAVAA